MLSVSSSGAGSVKLMLLGQSMHVILCCENNLCLGLLGYFLIEQFKVCGSFIPAVLVHRNMNLLFL